MTHLRTGFLALALIVGATPAFAHAELEGASPKQKSTAPAPQTIVLHFSEGLDSTFSKLAVVGPDGKPVALKVAVDPKDDKTLTGTPAAPLAAGMYKVNWTSVAHDAHKLTGSYDFTVK